MVGIIDSLVLIETIIFIYSSKTTIICSDKCKDFQKHESDQNDPSKARKSTNSYGRIETVLQNKCLYQVPNCFGNIASKKSKHKFYNSTVQEISKGGGDCATKVGSLCACFVDIVSPVKNKV